MRRPLSRQMPIDDSDVLSFGTRATQHCFLVADLHVIVVFVVHSHLFAANAPETTCPPLLDLRQDTNVFAACFSSQCVFDCSTAWCCPVARQIPKSGSHASAGFFFSDPGSRNTGTAFQKPLENICGSRCTEWPSLRSSKNMFFFGFCGSGRGGALPENRAAIGSFMFSCFSGPWCFWILDHGKFLGKAPHQRSLVATSISRCGSRT